MRTLWTLLAFGLTAGVLLAPVAATRAGDEEKKPILRKTDKLTEDDAKDTKRAQSFAKTYTVKLKEGQLYRIDMVSKETDPQKFDPFLRLENAGGEEVAFDDDGGGFPNAKILYKAPTSGKYKVIATTFGPNMVGSYVVTVKAATKADEDAQKTQAKLIEAQKELQKQFVEIQKKVNEFRNGSAEEQKQALDDLVKDFTDRKDKLTLMDAQYAMGIAQAMEAGKNVKMATTAYRKLGKALAEAENTQVAQSGRRLEGSARRINLVGKTMKVSGKTLEGKEVNLQDYKGKVVLIDFWATWCGPCIAEMPNLKKQYATYHGKGFEVVAVSVDRDREALVKFLKDENKKLPWVCIHDTQANDSLSNYYGVLFIPLPILIDREGRVVSMNARGPELERLLKKYVGEASE